MHRGELLERTAHNEDELFRDMVRRSRGALLEEDGLMLLAGPSRFLRIGMRTDTRLEPAEVMRRAEAFFADREPGWTLCVRGEADAGLAEAAASAGFALGWEEIAMTLEEPPAPGGLPAGTELRQVTTAADVRDFATVVTAANDRAEAERALIVFERPESILAPHVRAFVAADAEGPVSTAMTLVSHGVAGVYWVATVERARRRGLGDALTRAATRAGFDMGGRAAWLGASRMGASLYRSIGFRDLDVLYGEYESPARAGDAVSR
jgi:ribosomal protein S18 acetylase RimI-like enzyme